LDGGVLVSVGPLTLEQPLEIDDARRAARRLADQRREAETELERQTIRAADAELAYRKAFAVAFIEAKGTAGEREAKAKDGAGRQARDRDIQQGMVRVLTERLRGLEGERAMLRALMDWSMRMSADEHEHRAGLVERSRQLHATRAAAS
jgi:hypothetical protein